MAADELALLFRLRGDASGLKTATAEARAATNQLAKSFGPELAQAANVSQKAFESVGNQVNQLVRRQLPVVGNVVVSVTEGIKKLGDEAVKGGPSLEKIGKGISSIAKESGKSNAEVSRFLATFVQLGGQAKRDAAAIEFFGAALASKLIPELEKTGEEMAVVSARAATMGSRLAGLVNPVTITAAALAAYGAVAFLVGRQLFEITKRTGQLEGKLADLSQQTGLAVETLSALEIIAKQNGLEIGSLVNSLNQFQRRLEEARDPTSKMGERLRALGVEATETEGALREALQGLFALGEGSNQTAQALELFGARGGRAILAVLKQVNGDLDKAIEQFREMGILISGDAARSADQFNDELEILNRQIEALTREMGRELLPVMTDLVKTFAEFFRTVRPVASVIGKTAVFAVQGFTDALKTLRFTIAAVTLDYRTLTRMIEESRDALRIPEIQVAAPAPVPLPAPQTDLGRVRDAVAETEAVLDAVRRAVGEGNQKIEQEYEKGRISRDQQVFEIIRRNNDLLQAEKSHIDARIDEKERELKELQSRGEGETEAFRKSAAEIVKLQQGLADAESETRIKNNALRFGLAKKNAEDLRKQEQETTQLILAELDKQIEAVRSRVQSEIGFEREGLELIEQLELAKVDSRKTSLERQRALEFLTLDAIKEIDNEIRRINQERDALIAEQERARLRRARAESQTRIEILEAELDAILRIGVIHDEARIASIRSLADLQLQTEETTAREILRIRLDAIKREEEVIRARLETRDADVERVAAPIRGRIQELEQVKERNREEEAELERLRRRLREINQARIVDQTDLNNQLRILKTEEQAIEAEGNRQIDEGRQRDLEDRKQYLEDISRIQRRIADIERDTAKEIIDQMILGFASRKQIVRAQTELEIRRANERHRRNQEDIRRDKDEVAERLAGLQGFLRAIELTGKRELTVYESAIKARVTALNQQKELNQQEREELAQHQRILSGIRTQRDIQDYEKAIRARVEALERQGDLNQQEQEELAQHHAILQALREREEQSIRAGTLRARIDILERQASLNAEEEAELQRHYAELAEIRGSEDLGGVIERRIAVLTEQKRLNAEEERELQRHQETLSALRVRTDVQDYQRAIEARVEVLGRQKDLNSQEQAELRQHQEILQALREREQRLAQVDVLQARIAVLERQKSLNRSEQEELKRHYGELKRIRESDTLIGVIERRVAVLSQQKDLNAEEEAELRRHQQVLSGLRSEVQVQDYRRALQARADALARQKELNAEEQRELQEHQNILQALRERDERIIRITGVQARVEFLQKQKELNAEEQAELEGHLNTLAQLRDTEDLETSIQKRVDQLNKQRELNAQEQAELKNHQATLDAIRGRAGVDVYAQQLQARVDALRQQGELNAQEQGELRSHLEVLDAIRLQGERQRRIATLQNRVETLRQQRQLNEQEKQDLERQQAELNQLRSQEDFRVVIQRRVDYLRRQTELNRDEQEELKNHEAVLKTIREGGLSFAAAIQARVEYLRSLKELTAEERAELENHLKIITQLEDRSKIYEDALQKRIEFLEKQKELNAEEKAELERHKAEIETIERRRRLEAKEADPIGRLDLDVDNLKEFASVIENSIVPLGEILTKTFLQVADAIGQTVANWVLLGETGPAVMRKILAQALASIAAEAAVNAIKELALGFATLFFNPAESAAHFKAAALWAAVGGAAAVAGRATAGNLFKPTAGGGAQGQQGPQQLNPLTLQRNAGPGAPPQFAPQIKPREVNLNVKVSVNDGQFAKAITATVVNDVNNSGPIREVIANDGNLSRG